METILAIYCILKLTNENETLVYNVAERPTIKLQKADLLSASQIKELLVHTSYM